MKVLEKQLLQGAVNEVENEFTSTSEFVKKMNSTLIMNFANEIIEDFDHREAICSLILEEDFELKKVKAEELLDFYVDEDQRLIENNGFDSNTDQALIVADLMVMCLLEEDKNEDFEVLINFKNQNSAPKISTSKV